MSSWVGYPGLAGGHKLKCRVEESDTLLMGLMKRINRSPLTPWLALLLVAFWLVSPAMGMGSCCMPTGGSGCTTMDGAGGDSCCRKPPKVVEESDIQSCCKKPHEDSRAQDSGPKEGKTSHEKSNHSNCQCVSIAGVAGLMLGDTHDLHIPTPGMVGLESWIDCPPSGWVGSIFHPPLA